METRGVYQLGQATPVAGFKLNSRLTWRIMVFLKGREMKVGGGVTNK